MKLLTTNFNTYMANDFLNSFVANNYFMIAAKTSDWANGSADQPVNSEDDIYLSINEQMIFGKYIEPSDVNIMFTKVEWTANTVYPTYDDLVDLEDTEYYVVTQEGSDYSVFKCLDNNGGSPSTQKPILSETSVSDDFYRTSDFYVWKLMMTIPAADYSKFSTAHYIPLISNTAIANNAVDGAIDSVVVDEAGANYRASVSGVVTQINISGNSKKFYVEGSNTSLSATSNLYTNSAIYFTGGAGSGQLRTIVDYDLESNEKYIIVDDDFTTAIQVGDTFEISPEVTIVGDGTGFQGRAIIDSSSGIIQRVDIIDRGSGYTQAIASVVANTTSFDPDEFTEGEIRAIISPRNGHGSDAQRELYGRYVGVSTDFIEDNLPTANNDFHKIAILRDPLFRNVEIQIDSLSGLANGDVVTQATSGAEGTIESLDGDSNTITLTSVDGIFDSNGAIVSSNTSYTVSQIVNNIDNFDQRTSLNITITFGTAFEQDEEIIQQGTLASGTIHEVANNTLKVVDVQTGFEVSGTNVIIGQSSGTRAVINSISEPDMIKGTGEMMYIEHFSGISRSASQTERIKVVIGF